MSTAPAVMAAAPVDVASLIKFQQDCVRTRKFEYFAHVQRIVLEVTAGMYIPPELEEDLKTDPSGPCIEFFGQENWLPLGIVKAAGQADFLLPIAPVVRKSDGHVGFPDKPDRHWVPGYDTKSGGREPIMERDANGIERFTGKLTPAAQVKYLRQDLRTFSRGILRDSNFIVYERVAQILLKPAGLSEGWIAHCGKNPATDTHMTFLVDRLTGEAHFYGGTYVITRPGVE